MMKNKLGHFLVLVFLAACSPPRYYYYFDRHTPTEKSVLLGEKHSVSAPVEFTASSAPSFYAPAKATLRTSEKIDVIHVRAPAQIKEEVAQRKEEMKKASVVSPLASPPATEMDKDLKFSFIFGASGIVFLIIGGSAFLVVGSICLIIGLIFFLKWILRQ